VILQRVTSNKYCSKIIYTKYSSIFFTLLHMFQQFSALSPFLYTIISQVHRLAPSV